MSESIISNSNLPLSPSKSTKSNHHQVDGILSSPPIPTTTANNSVKDHQSSINQANQSHPNDDTPPPSSPIQPSALGIPFTRNILKNPNPFINSLSSPFSSSSSKSTSTTTPSLTALALGASPTKPFIQKFKPSTHLNASRNSNTSSTDPKAGFKKLDNDQLKLEKDLVDELNKKRAGGEKQQPLTPVTHLLLGSYSHSLVLGRGKPNGAAHNSSALINANGRMGMMGMGNGTGGDHQESPSPSTSSGLGAKKSQHVLLPNTARHVSRAHAVVEYIPFSPSKDASNGAGTGGEGSFVVRILGQNGLIVNGKRRKEGSVIPLVPASNSGNGTGNQEATLLDFFGMCARFDVVGPAPSFSSRSNTTMASSNKPRSSLSEKLGLTRNGNLQDGTSPIKSSNLTHKPRKSLLGSSIPTSTSTSSKTVKSNSIPAALASSSPISSSPSLRDEIPSSPSALRGDANGSDLSSSPSSVDQEQRRDEDQDGDEIMNESNSPSRGRGNSKGVGKGHETSLGKRSRNGSSQKEKKRISNTITSSGRRHHSRSNTRAISTTREDQSEVTLEIVPDSQMDLDDSEDDEDEDQSQSQIQKGEERVVDSNSESESDSDSSSGEESELTPSPSASPEPVKRRHHQNNKNKKQRLEEPSSSRNQDEEELSESQVQMPPPALPNKNRVKFLETQVDSSSNSTSSSSSDSSSSSSSLQTLARYCISTLSPTYDLEGLLAGSIVFHRTATISATEAVKSVLAGTPSMMKGQAGGVAVDLSGGALSSKLKHGDVVPGWKGLGLKDTPLEIRNLFGNDKFKVDEEKWSSLVRRAWREKLEIVLQSKEMFGVIQRKGRDASGNPLEHWYY